MEEKKTNIMCADGCQEYSEGYAAGLAKGREENEDDMASAVIVFAGQCGMMAEENWTEQQVRQLKWLFGAVLAGEKYEEYALKHMEDEDENETQDD